MIVQLIHAYYVRSIRLKRDVIIIRTYVESFLSLGARPFRLNGNVFQYQWHEYENYKSFGFTWPACGHKPVLSAGCRMSSSTQALNKLYKSASYGIMFSRDKESENRTMDMNSEEEEIKIDGLITNIFPLRHDFIAATTSNSSPYSELKFQYVE